MNKKKTPLMDRLSALGAAKSVPGHCLYCGKVHLNKAEPQPTGVDAWVASQWDRLIWAG